MTTSQSRRRIAFVGVAVTLAITGCLGLAVRVDAVASPPAAKVARVVHREPAAGVVVKVSEDSCAPQGLTVLAAPVNCG